jgi:hypothetical protein
MSRQWLYRSMLIFAGGVLLRADSLSLRSGKKVDGTFLGASIASLIIGDTRSRRDNYLCHRRAAFESSPRDPSGISINRGLKDLALHWGRGDCAKETT